MIKLSLIKRQWWKAQSIPSSAERPWPLPSKHKSKKRRLKASTFRTTGSAILDRFGKVGQSSPLKPKTFMFSQREVLLPLPSQLEIPLENGNFCGQLTVHYIGPMGFTNTSRRHQLHFASCSTQRNFTPAKYSTLEEHLIQRELDQLVKKKQVYRSTSQEYFLSIIFTVHKKGERKPIINLRKLKNVCILATSRWRVACSTVK